jgi:tetratricopeptide (TPR) repeat protein
VLGRSKENSGDDARVTKRPEEAETDFREALRFAELIPGDPGGSSWKDEMPHAHERLGDILRDEGKFAEAIAEFREFIKIEATNGSDSPGLERNFAVLHGKIGDMLFEQGDLTGAIKEFEKNLAISEKLGRSFPNNTAPCTFGT